MKYVFPRRVRILSNEAQALKGHISMQPPNLKVDTSNVTPVTYGYPNSFTARLSEKNQNTMKRFSSVSTRSCKDLPNMPLAMTDLVFPLVLNHKMYRAEIEKQKPQESLEESLPVPGSERPVDSLTVVKSNNLGIKKLSQQSNANANYFSGGISLKSPSHIARCISSARHTCQDKSAISTSAENMILSPHKKSTISQPTHGEQHAETSNPSSNASAEKLGATRKSQLKEVLNHRSHRRAPSSVNQGTRPASTKKKGSSKDSITSQLSADSRELLTLTKKFSRDSTKVESSDDTHAETSSPEIAPVSKEPTLPVFPPDSSTPSTRAKTIDNASSSRSKSETTVSQLDMIKNLQSGPDVKSGNLDLKEAINIRDVDAEVQLARCINPDLDSVRVRYLFLKATTSDSDTGSTRIDDITDVEQLRKQHKKLLFRFMTKKRLLTTLKKEYLEMCRRIESAQEDHFKLETLLRKTIAEDTRHIQVLQSEKGTLEQLLTAEQEQNSRLQQQLHAVQKSHKNLQKQVEMYQTEMQNGAPRFDEYDVVNANDDEEILVNIAQSRSLSDKDKYWKHHHRYHPYNERVNVRRYTPLDANMISRQDQNTWITKPFRQILQQVSPQIASQILNQVSNIVGFQRSPSFEHEKIAKSSGKFESSSTRHSAMTAQRQRSTHEQPKVASSSKTFQQKHGRKSSSIYSQDDSQELHQDERDMSLPHSKAFENSSDEQPSGRRSDLAKYVEMSKKYRMYTAGADQISHSSQSSCTDDHYPVSNSHLTKYDDQENLYTPSSGKNLQRFSFARDATRSSSSQFNPRRKSTIIYKNLPPWYNNENLNENSHKANRLVMASHSPGDFPSYHSNKFLDSPHNWEEEQLHDILSSQALPSRHHQLTSTDIQKGSKDRVRSKKHSKEDLRMTMKHSDSLRQHSQVRKESKHFSSRPRLKTESTSYVEYEKEAPLSGGKRHFRATTVENVMAASRRVKAPLSDQKLRSTDSGSLAREHSLIKEDCIDPHQNYLKKAEHRLTESDAISDSFALPKKKYFDPQLNGSSPPDSYRHSSKKTIPMVNESYHPIRRK